jgi:hypothetical protein
VGYLSKPWKILLRTTPLPSGMDKTSFQGKKGDENFHIKEE